jgi:spore coat protein U-like protein
VTATRGAGTSSTHTASFYGRIMPNQPTVPSANNGNTVHRNTFSGAQTSINVEFYTSVPSSCAAITTTSGAFPFTVTATVINECTINTTNVNFGTAGMLDQALNATGALSVHCTNGNAYRVALNGGVSNNVASRYMARATGVSIVSYQLFTDAGRNLVWGDGTAGTSMVTGTGTGRTSTLTIHGRVPAQRTPPPGAYRDTITATISF